MLVRYIRDEKTRKPYGCVVATGAGQVGWSLCHPNDNFSKKLARTIASGRAQTMATRGSAWKLNYHQIHVLGPYLSRMVERSHKYYNKDKGI